MTDGDFPSSDGSDLPAQPWDERPQATPTPADRIERFTSEQRGVMLGAGVVAAVIVILAVVAFTVGRDRSTTNLGDDRFNDVRADNILTAVDEGGPVFFADLTDGGRDIYVTHVGDDPIRGFLAFSARSPSTDCLVRWLAEEAMFSDLCEPDLVYGPDGVTPDGITLEQYPVELVDGRLVIDINYADRADQS